MAAATLDQAAVDKRAREIETEYLSSLADLNVNSKPLINMLTILAEENLDYAPIIVNAVEKHLSQVQPEVKLPILYLIDSIVKNVGKQYQSLFSQVIVSTFCGVFETVNERVREKMFSLRQTWNEVFPQSKLYALDIKINSIDPGWPITAQLKPKSPAIHVNPMFLKNKVPESNLDMQQQLRDKQRELLELQARKLELELIATKKRIEEQEKQLVLQTASVSKEGPELKRPASAVVQPAATHPNPRGRILPPNQGMINLIKSRDPRLARRNAALAAAPSAVTAGVSSTVVAGVQIPAQPDKERLGRIPKRVDPRLKAQQVDADRKKVTSTTTSGVPALKSRAEYDVTKKRERKDDARLAKSSSLKSSSSEKKKPSSESSPSKSSPSSKKKSSSAEKSPSRSEKSSPKSREGKHNKISSSSSSESIKSGATRRPRETSKSPNRTASPAGGPTSSENLVPIVTNNESKDVDLRVLMPEKKLKLDHHQHQQQANLVMKPVVAPDQKNVLGEAAVDTKPENALPMVSQDIDLRIPPPALLKDVIVAVPDSVSPGLESRSSPVASSSTMEPASSTTVDSVGTVKKRPSNHKYEEPASKKSKSEKIDVLFGDEDVDLRKLAGPLNPVEVSILPPPPPIISTEPTNANVVESSVESPERQHPSSKAALEAVRAKIAEATKNKDRDKLGRPLLYNKLPDDPAERRRSINQPKPMDVDLRQQQQQQLQDDDNSQDGMNANIKTIIAQAQEQMEKGEITPEQYNILMKQVIQLNETQKIRQAQRMELMKRSHQQTSVPQLEPPEEVKIDDDNKPSTPPTNEDTTPPPPAMVNDFRGKVAPQEAKSKFNGQTFANATAADLRQRDPRRPRDGRFNPQTVVQQPAPGWPNRGHAPVQSVPAPSGLIINHRPPAPLLNPWDKAPFSRIDQNLIPPPPIRPHYPPPIVGMNSVVPAPMQTMLMPGVAKLNDSVRTINIDGIQREIRFYDDIAVIFMSWDEPKEIGFQKGSRMVVVDDRDSFELSFNECYKAITIEGKVYQMKLGAPTRELYIDNSWYECYFGDPPSNITLDGITRVFKISGPAPQVKIGNSRNDLVAGKINMIVNAETIIPVFLDSQVQMFEIQGTIHKLQFADFLLTVILDDHPYPVEFGGLPKVFKLRGKDYYIRFTAIPKLVVAGRVYIRDMIRTPLHRDLRTPPRDQSMLPPFMPQLSNVMSSMSGPQNNLFPAIQPQAPLMVPPIVTGLDYLTNLMPHSIPAANVSNNLTGYQIQSEDKPSVAPVLPTSSVAPTTNSAALPILQNINIDELYKKIVAAGILTKSNSAPASTSTSATSVASKLDKALEEELEEIEPVFLNKPDQLKKRQAAIVSQLFCGMQCSSCGVRFPPEQTMKYSQHLDWHFRQNRRDRDSARKAHSRKWYYDVSDWIQYEEIEDLEEREKNWFETQQTEQTEFNGDGETGGRSVESPLPSCPAGTDEEDKRCHMCHDEFEQFYCEDTEEWHLRNAIRAEENTYHPLCYEDYKTSLTLDETAMNATSDDADKSKADDDVEEVKIKQEVISDADDTAKEISLDDDDDVIVLPPTKEVVTEIPDDDDVETLDSHSTGEDGRTQSAAGGDDGASKSAQEPQIIETRIDDDIAIQEPTIENITVNDLDESEELRNVPDESSQTSQPIKVKEEPRDQDEIDEEDAQFEDVGTLESSVMVEDGSKDTETVDLEAVPSPAPALESTSQSQLKPSLDGNVELQDAPATTSIITNRIKINITKSKTTNTSAGASSTATSTSVSSHGGGSSIAVLVSGGGGGGNSYVDNCDDLLYANLDEVHGGGGGGDNSQNSSNQLIMMMHEEELEESNKGPVTATEEEPTDLAYDLKPSLHGIEFIRQPRVENGLEQSGLCSIM
uniref:Pre-mRNA cleavage complex 2 protein Pcf11 n=1 Tax=Culex tarsalis TaxID=7177 RepID=A0A1Q3FY43_CULTA